LPSSIGLGFGTRRLAGYCRAAATGESKAHCVRFASAPLVSVGVTRTSDQERTVMRGGVSM
jgi:hypothetical protein